MNRCTEIQAKNIRPDCELSMNQDLNLALDGAEWPASRHVHFIPGREPSLGDWLGFRTRLDFQRTANFLSHNKNRYRADAGAKNIFLDHRHTTRAPTV